MSGPLDVIVSFSLCCFVVFCQKSSVSPSGQAMGVQRVAIWSSDGSPACRHLVKRRLNKINFELKFFLFCNIPLHHCDTMDKLTRTLRTINSQASAIIAESGQKGNSGIVNAFLNTEYPALAQGKHSSKAMLLAIWNHTLIRAAKKMSRTWSKLMTELNTTLFLLYSNENSRETATSMFRKPLKYAAAHDANFDKEIYIQSTHILGVSQERALARKLEYKDKVKARNANRGELVPIYIEQIYEIIDKLILSNNAYELSIAVLLATGSRSVELYKVSTYEEMNEVYRIRVIGIAKDKSDNNLANVVLVRNLVRLTGKQVVDAVHKIRTKLGTEKLTNAQISNKTNTALNKKFREHIVPIFEKNAGDRADSEEFKEQLKTLTSHKLRYIGGNASYQIYGRPKNIPETSYLQNEYGHLNAESTKSYLAIAVKYEAEPTASGSVDLIPFENRITDLEEKVATLVIDAVPTELSRELAPFANSYSKSEAQDSKVEKVVGALKLLARKKIKMTQSELRDILGFSGANMTAGYKAFRAL
jgi:hypothetical protein